jgi:hypothetical protein
MEYLLLPLWGNIFGGGSALVGEHSIDFAAEDLLIKLESGLAVAVEK